MLALVSVFSLTGCRPDATIGPPPELPRAEHVVVGELHGRTGAFLTVSDAASRVEVTLASLPGQLYRISTPADSGLTPTVSGRDGRIRASLRPAAGAGPNVVRIVLNRAVRWDIRLPAGGGEQQLDLADGRISRLDLGGSGLVELRLPEPIGTVPITFTGSIGTILLTVGATPIRVQLDRGAGQVVTPWTNPAPAAGRTVLLSRAWARARNRYAVRVQADLQNLLVQNWQRRRSGG